MSKLVGLDTDSLIEQMNKPNADWILKGLRRGSVGFLLAAPDSGKSYLSLSIAYELATGIPLLGVSGNEFTNLKTLYWPVEDGCENTAARILRHFDEISPGNRAIIEQCVTLRDASDPICCSRRSGSEESAEARKQVELLINDCDGYDLLIIDTMRQAMGTADEVEDDRTINSTLKEIAQKANVAILIIHHPTKAAARGIEAISSVSASGISYTAANSRLHLYIKVDPKRNDKKHLAHTKSNYLDKKDKLDGDLKWSNTNLVFLNLAGFDALVSKDEIHSILKQPAHSFEDEDEVIKEPLTIEPDESKLSAESVRKAKESKKRDSIIDDELLAKLASHRARKRSK